MGCLQSKDDKLSAFTKRNEENIPDYVYEDAMTQITEDLFLGNQFAAGNRDPKSDRKMTKEEASKYLKDFNITHVTLIL